MKKLLAIILFVVTTLSLCSCGKIDKNIAFSGEAFQTLEVEIYHLEKTYSNIDVHSLRDENTPLCVINGLTTDGGKKVSDLMNEISSLPFVQEVIYFPAPVDWVYAFEGYVVCFVYSNGYDIIAPNGQFYYSFDFKGDKNYKYGHADYSGEIEWSSIIKKYIADSASN